MRPPLTRIELGIIHDRNRGQADVEALLWEVARLRARLLRVDQLQASIGDVPPGSQRILECLRDELRIEPCIPESEGRRPEIIRQFRLPHRDDPKADAST